LPLGTGAFRIVSFDARRRAVFVAHEEHWGGRPFVDAVEVELGVPPREQMIAFEVGRADVVELSPVDARRSQTAGRRVWSSEPVELLAILFEKDTAVSRDARAREALALSIDRASIHSVLLQRQGDAAGGLLPQWLSGYAFLFPMARDLERAKQLWNSMTPARASVVLSFEPGDALAQSVAERVVVNARDAGIPLQAANVSTTAVTPDARLVRIHFPSIVPEASLNSVGETIEGHAVKLVKPNAGIESVFEAEKTLLSDFRVIPILHLRQSFGLGAAVKNWMPTRMGDWRLENVWLDRPQEAPGKSASPGENR
jgi:ABC-type transport system substrate-binding protein